VGDLGWRPGGGLGGRVDRLLQSQRSNPVKPCPPNTDRFQTEQFHQHGFLACGSGRRGTGDTLCVEGMLSQHTGTRVKPVRPQPSHPPLRRKARNANPPAVAHWQDIFQPLCSTHQIHHKTHHADDPGQFSASNHRSQEPCGCL